MTLEVKFHTGGRTGHVDTAPIRGWRHTSELAKASQNQDGGATSTSVGPQGE